MQSESKILCGATPNKSAEVTHLQASDSSLRKRASGKSWQAEKLLRLLDYYVVFDSAQGEFLYKRIPAYSKCKLGASAGYIHYSQDTCVCKQWRLNHKAYRLSHLVWLWYEGEFPTYQIDHINGNPLDNRRGNLRDVPQKVNNRNLARKCNNTTGETNINWDASRNKYAVRVRVDGYRKALGRFPTIQQAIEVRDKFYAENPQLGYTARHGT